MAIAFIQKQTVYGIDNSSQTLSFPSTTTTGHLIVVAIASYKPGYSSLSVNDNKGNTYSKAGTTQQAGDGNTSTEIWYAKNITGGSGHNVTISQSSGNAYISACVMEYSGVDTASPFDQSNGEAGTSATPSSGNVTTTINGELYVGVMGPINNVIITAETNWNDRFNNGSDVNQGIDCQTYGDTSGVSAGTYAATWTLSGASQWAAAIAAFKPQGTSGTSSSSHHSSGSSSSGGSSGLSLHSSGSSGSSGATGTAGCWTLIYTGTRWELRGGTSIVLGCSAPFNCTGNTVFDLVYTNTCGITVVPITVSVPPGFGPCCPTSSSSSSSRGSS